MMVFGSDNLQFRCHCCRGFFNCGRLALCWCQVGSMQPRLAPEPELEAQWQLNSPRVCRLMPLLLRTSTSQLPCQPENRAHKRKSNTQTHAKPYLERLVTCCR